MNIIKSFLQYEFSWQLTTVILCIYGFLKEFRPSEPYLYEYEHVTLNISEHTLNSAVYPLWTYSYMIFLIPVLLLTDLLLYKPVIIIEAISYIIVWTLFCFGSSVLVQQIIEIFYGWATATEVAYFAYIYVKVARKEYKRVTSFTQAALQCGRFLAYTLSQLIILLHWGDYRTLNWISWGSLLACLVCAVALPTVSWRTAYEKKVEASSLNISKEEQLQATYLDFAKLHFKNFLSDAKTIYSDIFVVKWSIWWALASCAFYQITNYTQTLWGTVVDVKNSNVYNGFTEAACPLISIPVVLLMQRLRVDWPRWGESCLAFFSLIDAGLLFLMAKTSNLFVMYACYIIYRVIYAGMITIAQFNIAERLGTDSFGLVFGLNTFIALVLQSILTLVVVDSHGLGMSIRPQFIVYSCVHLLITVIFIIPISYAVFTWMKRRCSKEDKELMEVTIYD